MIQTVSVLAVLTLATVTVFLPRILRGRTNRIADWNWRWILAVMFFLPLALLYIMVWLEMLKGNLSGSEHPVGRAHSASSVRVRSSVSPVRFPPLRALSLLCPVHRLSGAWHC